MTRGQLLMYCCDQVLYYLHTYVATSPEDGSYALAMWYAYQTVVSLCDDRKKDDTVVKDTLWVLQEHCRVHNYPAFQVFSFALSSLLSPTGR